MEGTRKETKEFSKDIGIFEGKVTAINPSKEQLENILGTEIEKDPVYTGSKDGVNNIRITVWLKDLWSEDNKQYNCSFFLQNKNRENKDQTKVQYINSSGQTTWGMKSSEGKDLPTWFTHFVDSKTGAVGEAKEYRKAKEGEEELVNFIRSWLRYDVYNPDTNILLNLDKLFENNVKELTQEIEGEFAQSVIAMATIRSVTKEGEDGNPVTVNYQSVYNKAFAPGSTFKFFKGLEIDDDKIKRMKEKSKKNLQLFEKFVLAVSDKEYGCKDSYYIGVKKEFNPDEFINAGDKVLDSSGADY